MRIKTNEQVNTRTADGRVYSAGAGTTTDVDDDDEGMVAMFRDLANRGAVSIEGDGDTDSVAAGHPQALTEAQLRQEKAAAAQSADNPAVTDTPPPFVPPEELERVGAPEADQTDTEADQAGEPDDAAAVERTPAEEGYDAAQSTQPDDYDNRSLSDLRELARDRGLAVSGTKDELITRLRA
jgi:predicted phage tail protein